MDYSNFFKFLIEAEKLKTTYRYSTHPERVRDSTADHSWKLTFMAMSIMEEQNFGVNREQVLKLCLVHDLAEYITGDIDSRLVASGEITSESKKDLEERAMSNIVQNVGTLGAIYYNLWREYESQQTPESKFVKALDKLEAMIHMGSIKGDFNEDPKHTYHYADKAIENFPLLKPFWEIVRTSLANDYERRNLDYK